MALSVMTHLGDEIERAKEAPQEYVHLMQKDVRRVCKAVMTEMANELPEEAHTAEVCRHILHETEKMLDTRLIKLE